MSLSACAGNALSVYGSRCGLLLSRTIRAGITSTTPATRLSREINFLSGFRKRKIVFQVTQYKTFQILVQTFPEPWARGSPSVFHFRNRQRFQVPGFEWVHELLLFCLASNPAQFCAEISCGKTGLGHNCTILITGTNTSGVGSWEPISG